MTSIVREHGSGVRVWIDDRHPIFRRGLAISLTEDGFRVVGESIRLSPQPPLSEFDVLIFDADDDALTRVVRTYRDAQLVAVLTTPDERPLLDAVDGGVSAVLVRSEITPRGLCNSVRAVADGKAALPKYLLTGLLTAAGSRAATAQRAGMNTREVDVLRQLSEGESTRAIADSMCYSEGTVKNIIHDLLLKMNCRNRAHAVSVATRQGLI